MRGNCAFGRSLMLYIFINLLRCNIRLLFATLSKSVVMQVRLRKYPPSTMGMEYAGLNFTFQ